MFSLISEWYPLNALAVGVLVRGATAGLATSGVGYGWLGFHALICSADGYTCESHSVFQASGTGWHVSIAMFASASANVFLLRVTWVWYTPPPSSRQTCLNRLTDFAISYSRYWVVFDLSLRTLHMRLESLMWSTLYRPLLTHASSPAWMPRPSAVLLVCPPAPRYPPPVAIHVPSASLIWWGLWLPKGPTTIAHP